MSPSNSITILTIGIFILAGSRLVSLFWQPAMVPASIDVPTAWQSFDASTRAKFMFGVLLLGCAYAAAQVLDAGRGLQAFALVLILLPCCIGGLCCVIGATLQHRYYSIPSSEIARRSQSMAFDTLALVALLVMALICLNPALVGPAAPQSALATSLYQASLWLTIGLAVTVGVRIEPPFYQMQIEPKISWRYFAFVLAWLSWSMFKEHWFEALSPILERNGSVIKITSASELVSFQEQLVFLCLGGFLVLLALPFLQRQLQIIGKTPFLSAFLLSILPAILVTAVPFDGMEADLPPYAILAVAIVGAVIGPLLWHLCHAFISWLQLHQTSREIAAYPFHYLSVLGLIVLSWVGIVEADGIDRYFILVAQCTALSSWSIRRLA